MLSTLRPENQQPPSQGRSMVIRSMKVIFGPVGMSEVISIQ